MLRSPSFSWDFGGLTFKVLLQNSWHFACQILPWCAGDLRDRWCFAHSFCTVNGFLTPICGCNIYLRLLNFSLKKGCHPDIGPPHNRTQLRKYLFPDVGIYFWECFRLCPPSFSLTKVQNLHLCDLWEFPTDTLVHQNSQVNHNFFFLLGYIYSTYCSISPPLLPVLIFVPDQHEIICSITLAF